MTRKGRHEPVRQARPVSRKRPPPQAAALRPIYAEPSGEPSELVAVRDRGGTGAGVLAASGGAIAAAELSASVYGAIPGAIFDTALAALLLLTFVLRSDRAWARLLPVMALVALIRPISLAAVEPRLPVLAWYAFAGLPLLIGAVLAIRLVEEPRRQLHLAVERPLADLAVAAGGPIAGAVAYLLLRPEPLLGQPNLAGYAATIAILCVFGGLLEELIFRGLVLDAATHALGSAWAAVGFATFVSTALYWGSGSLPYLLLMAAVGVLLGLGLQRRVSLWGVGASHALMLVTMALLAQVSAR